MKRLFRHGALAVLLMFSCAAAEESVQADSLLSSMRAAMVSQGERDVQGHLRKGRVKVPFAMSVRGDVIAFQYKPAEQWKRFDLHIRDKEAEIMEVDAAGRAVRMPPSRCTEPIAGTDVCYEDLSLRFLYWRNGKVLDDASIARVKGRDCWVVELANPNLRIGQFARMRVWIDKENGIAWRIDGYDARGLLRKRFSITSVQKLKDGAWFFKQMKLEVRDPADPARNRAVDYIEIRDLPAR